MKINLINKFDGKDINILKKMLINNINIPISRESLMNQNIFFNFIFMRLLSI